MKESGEQSSNAKTLIILLLGFIALLMLALALWIGFAAGRGLIFPPTATPTRPPLPTLSTGNGLFDTPVPPR